MKNLSIVSLVAANAIPFFGMVFLGWSLFAVMFFYWLENIVIGFYNVLKMIKAGTGQNPVSNLAILFPVIFFIFHYGMFTLVHGVFIFTLFGPSDISIGNILIGLMTFLISHGVSYADNFIKQEEYKKINFSVLFIQPYKRIIVMHVTILFGGIISVFLRLPAFSVLLLVVMKTVIDIASHKTEHKKFSGADAKGQTARNAFNKIPWITMAALAKEGFKKDPRILERDVQIMINKELKKEMESGEKISAESR